MPSSFVDREVGSNLPECGICYNDPPVNGIQLNCRHIFCYSCIKSANETFGRCAICRAEIGDEFNFQDHKILGSIKTPTPAKDDMGNSYYWFYESLQGWWLYDADTNETLEQAYKRGLTKVEKFIAGGTYVIDLALMSQKRKDDEQGRTRRICRDTLKLDNIIGMSGLKGQDFKDTLEMMRMSDSMSH